MQILTAGLFITILSFVVQNESARILAYFPSASISHQVVFRPITQELAKRGHELVIITTDPAFEKGKAPDNIEEIDIHDLSYNMWRERFVKSIGGMDYDPVQFLKLADLLVVELVEMQLNDKEVKRVISNENKYDLILTEACIQSSLVISHLFKVPVIQINSFPILSYMRDIVGAPSHPIYYPDVMTRSIYNLSLVDKLANIKVEYQIRNFNKELLEAETEMFRRNFGPSFPTMNELLNNVDMLMLNVNPIWEGNHPYPPNVVLIGRLHLKSEKPLPVDLKAYLDSSKKGVIYMSFGTNVNPSNLPPERIQIFNKVFSKLPYDILWKWDKDDMPGKADNVKIFKWLPQSDLLRHPKVKLFITQAGLQSTDEAITAGVPLIAFPMLGDQWYNAEKYVYHKIGLKMDIMTLTEENLEASIKKVVEDKSYRENIDRLRSLMNDEPQTPLERAVWWTEYVIRHKGAKHLKSPMANISWAEYLVLDVLLLVLGVGSVILLISSYVLYILVKFLGSFGSQKCKIKSN